VLENDEDSDQMQSWRCLLCWQIRESRGWLVTDRAGSGHVEPLIDADDDSLYVTPDMTLSLNNDIYWSAPQEYIGNKVQCTCF